MGQVIEIEKWKQERNLGKTLGQLVKEYGDAQRAYIDKRLCHCVHADIHGYHLCEGCPANPEESA